MAKPLRLPSVSPEGIVYQHMARYMPTIIGGAFEDCGGQDRFNDWANKNYSDFVTTFLPRFIPKQVELGVSDSIEALLERADAMEQAQVIEGAYRILSDEEA